MPSAKPRSSSSPRQRSTSESPRARLDVDERRAQLLELGIALFSERSYDDVSIDDLAAAAGISKGLLYHYFPTKRDFYVAALRKEAASLLASTEPSHELPPLERARHGLDAYLKYVESHAGAFTALFRGGIGSDREVVSVVDETRARFLERLAQGLPEAQQNPLAKTLLRGWVGLVEVVSIEWAERRHLERALLCDRLCELLVVTVQVGMRP